jgi:hypothetical protein
MEYHDYVAVLRRQDPELADEIAAFQGLDAVLNWMRDRALPQGCIDLVGQDEFEYDFVVHLNEQNRWLAFGIT